MDFEHMSTLAFWIILERAQGGSKFMFPAITPPWVHSSAAKASRTFREFLSAESRVIERGRAPFGRNAGSFPFA
jgi:hypothetical protein